MEGAANRRANRAVDKSLKDLASMLREARAVDGENGILLDDQARLVAQKLAAADSHAAAPAGHHGAKHGVAQARLVDAHQRVVACIQPVRGPVARVAVDAPHVCPRHLHQALALAEHRCAVARDHLGFERCGFGFVVWDLGFGIWDLAYIYK